MTAQFDTPTRLNIELGDFRENTPSAFYVPGSATRFPDPVDRYQLQFHRSLHVVRCMVLGNGAGKTTVAGIEAAWWLNHDHPYQPDAIPTWPVQIIWVCQKFQQMDALRVQLEDRCLGRDARDLWNENKHQYKFPDGDTLTVFSNDGDWAGVQGIPADLIIVDEECDPKLWLELTIRRRGDKKTRYVVSATATQGRRWMYHDIYMPWLKHHADLGQSEDQAMRTQSHPYYWVWPKGGLRDNPAASDEDIRWYDQALANKHPAEQLVRKRGGFADLNEAPVFDHAALDDIEQLITAEGITGQLIDRANPNAKPDVIQLDGKWFEHDRFPGFRSRFEFIESPLWEGGRLTIYEMPRVDAYYVMGMDYAQGLATGDFDTAIVAREEAQDDGTRRLVQVAEAEGRWGQTVAPMLFFMLGMFFNEALAVGEANSMGLGNMQLMWKLGYTYQYLREQRQDTKVSPKTDRLGYFKGSPLPVQRLQQAISPRSLGSVGRLPPRFIVRGRRTLEQLRRYQYRPRSTAKEIGDVHDAQLVMGAPAGENDDLVSAAAGCVLGWLELAKFVKPEPIVKPGSIGDMLGHREVWEGEKPRNGGFRFARREPSPATER